MPAHDPVPITRFGLVCAVAFGAFLALAAVGALVPGGWWMLALLLAALTGALALIDVAETRAAAERRAGEIWVPLLGDEA